MKYLKGKELVNMLALWKSSSTIMLCIVGVYIILAIISGEKCIGYYKTRIQIVAFYANIIVKEIGIIITGIYIHSNKQVGLRVPHKHPGYKVDNMIASFK